MSKTSTRNLFAAAALQGLLSKTVVDFGSDDIRSTCDLAFKFADEMEARTAERAHERRGEEMARQNSAHLRRGNE